MYPALTFVSDLGSIPKDAGSSVILKESKEISENNDKYFNFTSRFDKTKWESDTCYQWRSEGGGNLPQGNGLKGAPKLFWKMF